MCRVGVQHAFHGFLQPEYWPPSYEWNILEYGINHEMHQAYQAIYTSGDTCVDPGFSGYSNSIQDQMIMNVAWSWEGELAEPSSFAQ